MGSVEDRTGPVGAIVPREVVQGAAGRTLAGDTLAVALRIALLGSRRSKRGGCGEGLDEERGEMHV